MGRFLRTLAAGALAVVLSLCGLVFTLWHRTDRRTREIPFSSARSLGRVGPDWAKRNGYEGESVTGETADFEIFDRDGFNASAVHPEIRRFYEGTADYGLAYEVRWHRGFRLGAWLTSFATTRLEQLNLPGRSADGVRRLESRLARVPDSLDPREGVVWTRTDPDGGEAVFVAIYATHDHEDVTYANVAVPLPWSNLSTVLRPETIEGDADGSGVVFTTEGPGDGGLYLITPLGPLDVPLSQSFRVWPASSEAAPASPVAGADLVATHEMWVCGRQFLTITYGISRAESDRDER